MASELASRSIYPECPSLELGREFARHVATTGQPETFPTISTTRPPDGGRLVVLAFPVDIERARRPHNDKAPCPVCCPRSSKWLRRGSFIWCEGTRSVYCVGPTCSTTGWAAARLSAAQNLFLQAEQERQAGVDLAKAVQAVDAQVAWIEAVIDRVRRIDELQAHFGRALPITRAALRRATRGSALIEVDVAGTFEAVGRIAGAGFLTSSWKEAAKLEAARAALLALKAEADLDDVARWAGELAPTVRRAKLKAALAASEGLRQVQAKAGEARAFLAAETFGTIWKWWKKGGAPATFSVSARTATTLEVKEGERNWRGQIGEVGELPPLPAT